MLQAAEDPKSGLFQYTDPLRQSDDDLVMHSAARVLHEHDKEGLNGKILHEMSYFSDNVGSAASSPRLHTLDFCPGTLLILSGSKSLHRVTKVRGSRSRLVAVLTFSSKPGFCNTELCQKMFWGRSLQPS